MPIKTNNKLKETSDENLNNESNSIKTQVNDIADEDYDTTDESEDDSALLLTDKVEDNIFKTLLKIKNKDPEIYNDDHKFFNDSDFEVEEVDKGPEKPFTYSDLVRETLLNEGSEAFEEDEEVPEKRLSYNEEQNELKKAFLEASKAIDDDEFFTKSETVDEIPESKPTQVQNKVVRENELISRYWSSEDKLDENEEFLRDYILNQRWREDRLENFKVDHTLDKIDEYDEEHLDKADEFECKYNFRFEEQDGAKIIGYPRNIDDSVRKPDDRRRQKRLEKRQRKKEEKIRRDEEIKRLKNLRKNKDQNMEGNNKNNKDNKDKNKDNNLEGMKDTSSYERIQEIANTAGVVVKHDAIDLDAPFDPEQHERDMKKIIGLGYDKDDVDDVPGGDDGSEEDEDPELWWMCDGCSKGIPAGQMHFDCKQCENYTLCEKCISSSDHEHKDFKSKKVPIICGPPEENEDNYDLDYEDYIADMPVKFKYRKVEPVPCDINMILDKSDKELNQMIPLKNLIGYDVPTQIQYKNKNKENKYNKYNKENKENKHNKENKYNKENKENKYNEKKKKKYLKSMTKYNVNRDRLLAFGLEKKKYKNNKSM